MSDRTRMLLIAAGLLAAVGIITWLAWGTLWLLAAMALTFSAIPLLLGAFIDGNNNSGNGSGGVGLGGL
ncbi:hypothetical protein [Streptomyces sp. JV180]|uniref:hypothetical protein n=1 Tax=Streptomyces sp. JV180 TaxID=858634 RepID=UPI00168A4DA6|nr:hypothetical protein [Streptomyces sp. JV180]MBD3549836.1 hypothetical protein [Streptomyces sp. JV180]